MQAAVSAGLVGLELLLLQSRYSALACLRIYSLTPGEIPLQVENAVNQAKLFGEIVVQ